MTDVKALLEQASPLPWHRHTYGHRSIRQAAGVVTRALFSVGESVRGGADRELRDTFTDLSYVHGDVPDGEGPSIALTGNGPKQIPNADLIVYAVNRLPDYEAAVDALERLLKAGHGAYGLHGAPCRCEAHGPAHAALASLRESVTA